MAVRFSYSCEPFPVSKLTRLLSQKNVFVDVFIAAILVSPVQCFKAYTEDKKYYATNEGLVRVPMFIPVSAKQVMSSFFLIKMFLVDAKTHAVSEEKTSSSNGGRGFARGLCTYPRP